MVYLLDVFTLIFQMTRFSKTLVYQKYNILLEQQYGPFLKNNVSLHFEIVDNTALITFE